MSQTPPKAPRQKNQNNGNNKKSTVKTGLSAMTKTFLGLLVIISIGLTIFLVNAWQQLKRANLADGQLSSGASVEVLTPNGSSAPSRNPDGTVFVPQETPTDTIASDASGPEVTPTINPVPIRQPRPPKQTPAPADDDSGVETPVNPTNVPDNNSDTQSAPPAQHKQKNGVDDLF